MFTRAMVAALVGVLVWSAAPVKAAVIVPVQQTLSRWSYVGKEDLRLDDNPPDVLVGNVYGAQTVSTKAENLNYPVSPVNPTWGEATVRLFASASMTTTVREDSIGVTAATTFTSASQYWGFQTMADARVVATITFDVTQLATFDLDLNTRLYDASRVTLTGPLGKVFEDFENGWSFFQLGYKPVHSTLTLDPGRYVLDISCYTATHMEGGGDGTMDFSMAAVPEPASVGAGLMGMGLLILRRRR